MNVAKAFGMLQPAASNTQAVARSSSSTPRYRAGHPVLPAVEWRNMQEIKRLLIAMQHSDEYGIATADNWEIGDDVIVPPPGSCGSAKDRVDGQGDDYYCLDWFLCFKKCDHGCK